MFGFAALVGPGSVHLQDFTVLNAVGRQRTAEQSFLNLKEKKIKHHPFPKFHRANRSDGRVARFYRGKFVSSVCRDQETVIAKSRRPVRTICMVDVRGKVDRVDGVKSYVTVGNEFPSGGSSR